MRANAEQVERFREVADGADFYGPVANAFRAEPDRQDDHVLNGVLDLVVPGETWLDIGAGGGRYALPIARKAGEVIAIDPSAGMLKVLEEGMRDYGLSNVRVVNERWPMAESPRADVAFIANVGMDIEQFPAFLDAMDASASRLCVAVMGQQQATVLWDQLWPAVHGEPRVPLPALPEFLTLLLSRGRLFELCLVTRPPMMHDHRDHLLEFARRQTWVAPGGPKDRELERVVNELAAERDGRYGFNTEPVVMGVVSWQPPHDGPAAAG